MAHVSRRSFLRAAAVLLASGAAGCGATPAPTSTSAPAATRQPATAAPAATPIPTMPPATAATPTTAQAPAAPTATAQALSTATRTATPAPGNAQVYLAVARGGSPDAITRAAIGALGGIERFVKPGNDVIIKPNICAASHPPEYASTTNPDVVATLVTMCREAGAKRVRVMDAPFSGTDGQAYDISGIEAAVKRSGGEMERMARMKYQDTAIPNGKNIKKWPVYQDVLNADVLINVPIAKDHGIARLTLGMKNLMGVVLDRSQIHFNLGQRLADLSSLIMPTLTVVDAVRILTSGGPTGGNLNAVKKLDTIIASHDIVAADAYATSLFNMKPDDLDYIKAGAAMNLGRKDIDNLAIARLEL